MKLLYAEDEPAMAEAVTDILNCHYFMVDAVQDGQEALDYARSGDYDGIILDIMLPKKSGLEVLSELRESGDRTPVLLLTAKSEVEDRILGLDLGADDYLPKPFAMGELLARVRAMLRRRKFVVTAMAGVTLLLLVLLGGINGVNLWLNSRDTDMLLNALADGEGTIRPERGGPGFFGPPLDGDDAMSAVFFIVRLDADGSAVYADTSRISTVTEDEAVEYAESAAAAGDASGREGRFRYRIAPSRDGRGSVAVFLDVSADERSMLIVAVLSLLAGAACWLAALLAAVLLSRRATRPIAESMERQKQFITDAGHEIKTPLAIIRANADALELHQGESR